MLNYFCKRLALLLPILFSITTIVFLLIHFIPGDPTDFILGEQALETDRAWLRETLHLNQPIGEQYLAFWRDLGRGEFGHSLFDRRPVMTHIAERYGATLGLAFGALFVAVLLGVPLGIVAALRQYRWTDSVTMLASLLAVSIPNFWLGPLLILLFSVKLGWLPVAGLDNFASFILPCATLGAAMAAILSRMTRSSMLEVLQKKYILTARAKGLSERRVILKHALKNALNPVITIVGLQVGTLLAGAVITEKVFNWPGLGSLLIESIQRRDYPVVQGCVLVIAFSYVVINALTDFCYRLFDPKVRLG